MPKIGITEQGDAALDLSWINRLSNLDGAILITKELTNQFVESILENKEKIVLHMTCTGYGGTIIEPNVPYYFETIDKLHQLVLMGFPIQRIVVRVDPIIPTEKGIRVAESVMCKAFETGFHRFRVSVLDMYQHVQHRFKMACLPLPYENEFQASKQQFAELDVMFEDFLSNHKDTSIECCAEPRLKIPLHTGCVGEYECNLFGVVPTVSTYKQRSACLCFSEKVELLCNKHPCSHRCLYCYWRD